MDPRDISERFADEVLYSDDDADDVLDLIEDDRDEALAEDAHDARLEDLREERGS